MTARKDPAGSKSWRERKKDETRQRIADAGLHLFLRDGYEGTTIEAIAEQARISRRTFFHYFRSKDEILVAAQPSLVDSLYDGLQRAGHEAPMAALRDSMTALARSIGNEELAAIDAVMLSSEAVQARKQATYEAEEDRLFSALCEHWPQWDRVELRLYAAICITISRLSLRAWRGDGGRRPLEHYVSQYFDKLGEVVLS